MIEIRERKLPITIEATRNILQEHTDNFGVFLDYDRICEYLFHYETMVAYYTKQIQTLVGMPSYSVTQNKDTINILISRLGVPPAMLTTMDSKLSVKDEIISTLEKAYDGQGNDVELFLKLYRIANSAQTAVSSYKTYRALPMSTMEDRDGHRMVVAHPSWEILRTSRISASDPSIQNIDRGRCDIITAPKGWQFVHSDSGQIEPRIMWSVYLHDPVMFNLFMAYNDAYYAYYDFITLPDVELRSLYQNFDINFKKKEINAELKEKRQELKRVSLACGYGSTLPTEGGFDINLARKYIARISEHPARAKLVADITEAVNNGADTFYGYFGSPCKPEATSKYAPGDKAWKGHLIRCGVNNPIQTTASELFIHGVYHVDKILKERARHSFIAYGKHDEMGTYLHEDSGDIDLAPEISECTAYRVEGWIPIYSECNIGRKAPHNEIPRLF